MSTVYYLIKRSPQWGPRGNLIGITWLSDEATGCFGDLSPRRASGVVQRKLLFFALLDMISVSCAEPAGVGLVPGELLWHQHTGTPHTLPPSHVGGLGAIV